MPNLVAHFGVQGWISRSAFRGIGAHWILLGCLIPDLPWILQRAIRFAFPTVDPYELRLYVIAQASLALCLLLCAALAALSGRPRVVFVLLAANSVLHLLLDASQKKWANGVHFFAPLSWKPLNFGFFWPENPLSLPMFALGLLLVIREWRRESRLRPDGPRAGLRRSALACALLAGYLVLPLAFLDGVEAEDNHSIRTLRHVAARSGRDVEFDRDRFVVQDGRGLLRTFAGEYVEVEGELPRRAGLVSARATFVDSGTVQIRQLHEHSGWFRDFASYLGLGFLALFWGRQVVRRLPARRSLPFARGD